ncbi:protein mono-ADP-ribosyltransferase PARP10-like [Thrips palmi]|uniref:Poly [ADP-ribose] polymerase n=1 Tax=Thrips palmi TaxID=161013 RepID=A0A6P9AHB1_THRPL|nr:protein mono-ADP-ribosyltransferase PARP10-like [Thrips palmi]
MASVVERTTLQPGTSEYEEVKTLFNRSNQSRGNCLRALSIEKVHNSYLEQRFQAKKQEYQRDFGQVEVLKLWHGTRGAYVDNILLNNYDVSRHGQGVGHRFGAGISFSGQSGYASNYCDNDDIDCMLLNDVLVSNIIEVEENRGGSVLREPPLLPGHFALRYDTTAKNKVIKNVIVKYESDACLPTHVVMFTRHAVVDCDSDCD